MTKRNPKQEGSNLWDCKTQIGNCPMNCNQCFANRPGAAYIPMEEQILPTLEEVGDGIVRANCLHDSNFGREELIEHCKQYKKVFYNTSIPKFDFPGPVVFTANSREEELAHLVGAFGQSYPCPSNLMFVRLRVSTTNLGYIEEAIRWYISKRVPIVLTFMAYYDEEALPPRWFSEHFDRSCVGCYEYKVRHVNSYWCPTKEFMVYVLKRMKRIGGRLVTICGTLDSNHCRDCRNCEMYYYQTVKHMKEME
ncbi:hypothetical protein KA005_10575 [bacterium]|nr:hypothetical protein [bacterium]